MCDIEFTIEQGKLYMLQTRVGKRTAAAALHIAIEMEKEGLISKEYAARLNKALGGRHTSFQIRLPFVKGMLHQVDFHDFFRSAGTTHLTDCGA